MGKATLMVDLSGRTALVTGGSKGIGKAICGGLAANGAAVAVNYNTSEEKAIELVNMLCAGGKRAIAVRADVSSYPDVKRMVDEIEKKLRDVDILVNNAGMQVALSTVEEITEELLERVIAINLKGAFFCSKKVIPLYVSRKEKPGSRWISRCYRHRKLSGTLSSHECGRRRQTRWHQE
jgi:3-oxoacyl-[acyl-carrier protein] reductase